MTRREPRSGLGTDPELGVEIRRAERARLRRKRNERTVGLSLAVVALALAIWLGWLLGHVGTFARLTNGLRVALIITGPGKGKHPDFSRPLAAAWSPSGRIYVSDTGNSRICVFDSDGKFVRELRGGRDASGTTLPKGRGRVEMPVGLDVDSHGNIYVADLRAGAVRVLDPRGAWVRDIRPKDAPGWRPTDVKVLDGRAYVTDADGVAIFTVYGEARGRLPIAGNTHALSRPNGVERSPEGTTYISDTNAFRVLAVTRDGTVSYATGLDARGKRIFGLPRGIGLMDDGSVVVADAFGFDLVELDPEGKPVAWWGKQGQRPGEMEFPNDIDVGGGLLLVADKENNRVQVFETPGRR